MRFLIIGGTAFIGRAIVAACVASGHEVTLFNRGLKDPGSPHRAIHGDVERLLDHAEALRALAPDVVVHCIAYAEQHARDLVEVFAGSDSHLIVLSSQDSYEIFQQVVRNHEVSDFPVDEGGALSSIRFYKRGIVPGARAETYDKNLMAAVLMENHALGRVRPTVLRLPMVYGPHDYQWSYRHGDIIRRIAAGRRRYVIGSAEQSRLWTFGYVENIAAAVVHAAGRPETVGQFYNLGERQVRSRRRWADLYARAADSSFEYWVVPDEGVSEDASERHHPPAHLVIDCRRFVAETGFVEPVDLSEAIQRTLAWGLAHPDLLGPVPDYDAQERFATAYFAFLDRVPVRK